MAPRNGNGMMFIDKTNVYLKKKKEKKDRRKKYLRQKVKQGTATPEDRKELKELESQ